MLYSSALLSACQDLGLVDDYAETLTREEKRLYSASLRNAVARINNDPRMSIGTEKLIISSWSRDDLGFYKRIVRNYDNNEQKIFVKNEEEKNNVSLIAWNSVTGRQLQELPQRLLTCVSHGNNTIHYQIVNAKDFFERSKTNFLVFYEVEENAAILRISQPRSILCIFNRAIYFPFETKPGERIVVNSENEPVEKISGTDLLPGEIDPLEMQIMLPTSHIPYFINLIAYEICLSQKMTTSKEKVLAQIESQETALIANNTRDRVKQQLHNNNYAFNYWNAHAYR